LHALERGEKQAERWEKPMGSYEDAVRTLDVELRGVEQAFRELTHEQWQTPTKLQPLDETQPHWTLFELAGHFDISIGLTVMLMAEPQSGQVGRDRTSFFIFPRSEVAPVVYDYAYKMVEGKTPDQMPDVLHETFTKTIEGARTTAPDTVGPGYYALMRLDEFVPSRVVEAVVHGLDLTDAIGREPIATAEGVTLTAGILDDLLARKTVAGRPSDLTDDMAWVRAASGRAEHPDPRLPLIG
jgi:Mycothiol maleylpyruvate isomerase N-terminal domain